MPGRELPESGLAPAHGPTQLALLGRAQVLGPAGSTAILTDKLALLAGYLASTARRSQRRARLAELLWPDRGDDQARGSLRNALSRLRALGIRVATEADSVSLGGYESDLDQLERASSAACDVTRALRLSEPFLEGFDPPDGELRDWLSFERTRCRTLAQQALTLASDAARERGEIAAALAAASRLLALDPYRERSHRLLMRLHEAAGDRASALAQYQSCRDRLRTELGVEPSEQTMALARRIAGSPGVNAGIVTTLPREDAPKPRAAVGTERFRLSVAVLPFEHDGSATDHRFLAEGIADDLTTALTRQRDFLVMARPSSLLFSNSGDAARSLDVRYVVTGTLRVAGGQVSVAARLIDEKAGRHLWAVRHEGDLDSFFSLRDRLIDDLVTGLDAEIRLAERERAAETPATSLGAWEMFHRGLWHAYRFEPAEIARAQEFFDRSLGLAGNFALPYAGLAYVEVLRLAFLLEKDTAAGIARGLKQAGRAFELDPSSPFILTMLGRLRALSGDLAGGFDLLNHARERHPSFAHVYYCLSLTHHGAGEPELALKAADMALRLSPRDPLLPMFLTTKAASHYFTGQLDLAEREARAALAVKRGDPWALIVLVLTVAELERPGEARDILSGVGAAMPGLQPAHIWPMIARTIPAAGRERVARALAALGVPVDAEKMAVAREI
ncbi:BTAD domain-containing putative transcriptional regulator [Ancylobacter amanitiformis]|uniref:DNA-binding SARP family transcriptional activator n=1 Tax=Ancylobacter amanitiformis TaxID=217069 RepID=A0ABU0LXT5_9HYPH|nr:BTAD domain-containing putative transcriptional regulator [Ancylobacter amanitiformis]MDQ0513531.1 DNA-binding SARP family transcriptional activator [Ancylobacter amanitiformis]